MEQGQLKCKIGRDIFIFDRWEFISLYGRQEDQYKSWVRYCLTKNGVPVVGQQSALFAHCPNPHYDPTQPFNTPRLEIEKTRFNSRSDLFFRLARFDFDLDAAIQFRHLEDLILPFPRIYTPAGDYEKAKRHCDHFVRAITNLLVFM